MPEIFEADNLTRADFVKKAGIAVLSTSALWKLLQAYPANAADLSQTSAKRVEAAYLPTWLEESDYQRIAKLNTRNINRWIISFAAADTDASLQLPTTSPGLKKLIDAEPVKSDVMLAVGGQAADPKGWAAALKSPNKFANKLQNGLSQFGETLGREIDGVDLDFEFPAAAQAPELIALVKAIRKASPDKKISMAIPPTSYNRNGFNLTSKGLVPMIDYLNVMTYNYAGPPWSPKAGDLAPGNMIIGSINETVDMVGDPRKVMAGIPAFGVEFLKAQKRGAAYAKNGRYSAPVAQDGSILFNQIPTGAVTNNMNNLSSWDVLKSGSVSFDSALVITAIVKKLYQQQPELGGVFAWHAGGMNQDFVDALSA